MLTVRINATSLRNNLSNLGLKFQESKDMKALLAKSSCQEAKTLIKDLEGKQKKFVEQQLAACKFGWVNLPEGGSLLVEANTGHAILSLDGNPIINVGRVQLPEHRFPMDEMIEKLMTPISEGISSWPYRDTKGYFTIGIGNKFDTWQDVKKAHEDGFRFTYDGREPTDQDFQMAFEQVINYDKGDNNVLYDFFQGVTLLRFSEQNTIAYTKNFVNRFVLSLANSEISNFSTFSVSTQLALADIIYNVGYGAFKNGWPKLKLALSYRDLETAADETHRKSISEDRNTDTKEVLLSHKETFFLTTSPEERNTAKQITLDFKGTKTVTAPTLLTRRFP